MDEEERQIMNWEEFKRRFLSFLKGEVFRSLLVKFIKAQAMGGFKAWIIKLTLEEFYDDVAEPYIDIAMERGKFEVTTKKGKIIVKKLEIADENNDQDSYDSSADDAFE